MPGQKQHVDLFRKLALRRQLLTHALSLGTLDGVAYVPFIGDGDIAAEVYANKFAIFGADLDLERAARAGKRLPYSKVLQADCNTWPFPGIDRTFCVADFDAYSDPYESFRAFWANAKVAPRAVLFFTDGVRYAVKRSGIWHRYDGERINLETMVQRRYVFNGYLTRHVNPWLDQTLAERGYRVERRSAYLRDFMSYHGAVIVCETSPDPARSVTRTRSRRN